MEILIGVVVVALIGLMGYAMYTEPPSTGCLAADADAVLRVQRGGTATDPITVPDGANEPAIASAPATEAEEPVSAPVAGDEDPNDELAPVLRNPLTGEVVVAPTNYRFAKKWIKEALVSEGLLDRVYATAELDEERKPLVKAALLELRRLARYRG